MVLMYKFLQQQIKKFIEYEELKTLIGHMFSVKCLVIIPGTNKIVSGSQDKTIKIWNSKTGKCIKTLECHTERIAYITIILGTDNIVFSGSYTGTINIWHPRF